MLFCKSCGNKLDDDAKFCPECGTPSSKKPVTNEVVTEVDDYKTQKQNTAQVYGVINIENIPKGHIIDNRYEVVSKVGQGGFGAVYHVYDKKLNIDKALKVLPESIVSDEEAMLDLKTEARTMIALNHQNIVRVYDFQETGNLKYIDMEYVDGKTLTKLKLEYENKIMPENLIRDYAVQIAKALAYAHNNNVIHKDIKPQNVMINSKGEVKIMDFGIAETVRTSMSRLYQTSSSGTLVYMSPEQLKGKNVGKESDIYSYGAMLYELLTGNPPFYRGDVNFQILNEKPESIKHISNEFNNIIMKCLEKEYNNRFKNFDIIVSHLKNSENLAQDIPILDENRNTNILKIVQQYQAIISVDYIYFSPNIPINKLLNAINTFANNVKQHEVLLLIDNTIFGSANDGLLLTSNTLYAHNKDENPKHIKLSELNKVNFCENILTIVLYLNDFTIHLPKNHAIKQFIEMLQHIILQFDKNRLCQSLPIISQHDNNIEEFYTVKSNSDIQINTINDYDGEIPNPPFWWAIILIISGLFMTAGITSIIGCFVLWRCFQTNNAIKIGDYTEAERLCKLAIWNPFNIPKIVIVIVWIIVIIIVLSLFFIVLGGL